MTINITDQCKALFLKWTILIWLNAAVSFYFAVSFEQYKQPADILGIIFGIFTFVTIYTAIDYYLIKIKAIKLIEFLAITVLLKALTQFIPIIELVTGMLSNTFIGFVLSNHRIPFITPYLLTLTDGILLSIVAGLLGLVEKCVTRIFKYRNI